MALILLADDDPFQCAQLVHLVQQGGHEVVACHSGKEAFDRARELVPDIVILDLHMENANAGIQYGARIQDQLHIPVILVSASSDEKSVLAAADIRPSAFLTKPCTKDQLNAAILIARSHALFLSSDLKIRELTHRVKNNLVSIYGFLELRNRSEGLSPTAVSELKAQILSMNMIYDHLSHKDGSLDKVDAACYFSNLIKDISSAFQGQARARVTSDLESMELDEHLLNSLGMFVNEALTNCFKYAFEGRFSPHNRIKVSLRKQGHALRLCVTDNGRGLSSASAGVSRGGRKPRSLGLSILKSIASTLRGSLKVEGDNGMKVTLKTPLPQASRVLPQTSRPLERLHPVSSPAA